MLFGNYIDCTALIELSILDKKSIHLHKDLIKWVPCETEERYRWDYLMLRLDADSVKQIKEELNIEHGAEIVMKKAIVEGDFGDALKHFNYVRGTRGLELIKLISRWERDISALLSSPPKKWIQELCAEIVRAVKNNPSQPIWSLVFTRIFNRCFLRYGITILIPVNFFERLL